jgi:excisionase family DNA binding protein
MPVEINGCTYYRTAEVCRIVGLSRTTFYRWLREGILKESGHRDRRQWRLFTKDEIAAFRAEAHRITKTHSQSNKIE